MYKIISPALVLFITHSCFSQFSDSVRNDIKFLSTGTINQTEDGNSYVLANGWNYSTRRKNVIINTSASWIYGELNNDLTNNDFNAHGDIDLYKGKHKLYGWALINGDQSYSLKINSRIQIGAGLAYNFIDSPYLRINISDGFIYEKGDILDPVLGRDIYQVVRNSFRLLYHWSLKDRLIIDGSHFFQPSLSGIHDYVIRLWSTLSVKVQKWLSITGAVTYNRLNRTDRSTLLITYGVTFEKYF